MAIPDYQTLMLPVLRLAEDQAEHSLREAEDAIAQEFRLTEHELQELLPSGRQRLLYNRVGWARKYLKEAGLLASPRRGHFRITAKGLDVLARNPRRIDRDLLREFPEFVQFISPTQKPVGDGPQRKEILEAQTPEEQIEDAYTRIQNDLSRELLEAVRGSSPSFFEQVVVDLLLGMGYGGTRRDAGQAIGRSGDEGIDGIIKEDRLGLDNVYVQAKRWEGSVGSPEVQKFVGALEGRHARKGVFITTSTFTSAAVEYASRIDKRVVLIDGEMLGQLMVDHSIGVNTVASYDLKRLDTDYFGEE